MPQLGENKPRKKERSKKDDSFEAEEIVSAYSPEGEKRRDEYEIKMKKKAKIVYYSMGAGIAVLCILLIIGALTNWFQG